MKRIRDYRTAEALLAMALDKSGTEKVRECARHAMQEIRDVRAIPAFINALKSDMTVGGFVSKHFARFGTIAIDPLSKAFRASTDRDTRLAIVSGLAAIDEPEVTGALLDIMESRDVREQTGQAFEKLTGVDVGIMIPHLRNWFSGRLVAKRLVELDWKPTDTTTGVHFGLAMRKGDILRKHWSFTERVLLDDVGVAKYEVGAPSG